MNKTREIGDIVFTIGLTKEKNGEWLYSIIKHKIYRVDIVPNGFAYAGYHNELFYLCYDSAEEAKEKVLGLNSTLVQKKNDNFKFINMTDTEDEIAAHTDRLESVCEFSGGIFDFI